MIKNLLQNLNDKQKEAVLHSQGPSIILAGAGSGKTRVLSYKSVYLMAWEKIPAEKILLVTFTNKAASEMKNRIALLLSRFNRGGELPFAGTFHSFCARILRVWGPKNLDISANFSIYDEQDSLETIKQILTNLDADDRRFKPRLVLSIISQAKNELISPLEYANISRTPFHKEVAIYYLHYNKMLKENQALDFDDLIFSSVKMLHKYPQVKNYFQEKYSHILIDEYQDTNRAQYELSKLLAGSEKNICVVGDASQSIYAWRGADFRNITNFKEDFPNAKIYYLEKNYRSTESILNAAYEVISKNKTHPILNLWTENGKGEKINLYAAKDEKDEARFIADTIISSSNQDSGLNKFAVLYRINAQSRNIEEAFLKKGIPYILVGGVRFYERKEIKDLLAYLRLLVNSKDSISEKRARKIGKKRYEKFSVFSNEYNNKSLKEKQTTEEIINKVLNITTYLDKYSKDIPEDLSRIENVKELMTVAKDYPDLSLFLEQVSLVEDRLLKENKKPGDTDAVTLMTIHSAKGLEFENVFIAGMEEGLFPHSRSFLENDEMEEERRLCYVAFTRAKSRLFLIYALKRYFFGQSLNNDASRFILDLPDNLINRIFADY